MASMLALAFAPSRIGAQELADSLTGTPETDEGMRTLRIRSTHEPEAVPVEPACSYQDTTVTSMPWMGYGMGGWDLHQGLNAQVGAGVRVGWGKHNPWRGASFFTDIAAMAPRC